MNRALKILLIAATCLLIFGILLTAGSAIAIRATGQHRNSNAQAIPRHAEVGSIQTLSLSLISEPIYLRRGGDSVIIEWSELHEDQYMITKTEGQSLSLSRTPQGIGWFGGSWNWNLFNPRLGFLGIDRASLRPVTVTIPDGMSLRNVDLSGANIRVNADDIEALEIDISGANVNAIITNVEVQEFSISGANASAALDNISAQTISISGANADAVLSDTQAHDIEVSGANATVIFNNISANSIDVRGANAEATMNLSSTDDWGFSVSGVRADLRIDGQRSTGFNGSNNISVSGANASLNVWTR